MHHFSHSGGDWLACDGYRKKILLTGTDLDTQGTLVQLIEIEPRTSVGDHYHNSCTEVFHITQGKGHFVIDGQRIDLIPGDTLTCHPGEVHSTHNESDAVFAYVVFKTNVVPDDSFWL